MKKHNALIRLLRKNHSKSLFFLIFSSGGPNGGVRSGGTVQGTTERGAAVTGTLPRADRFNPDAENPQIQIGKVIYYEKLQRLRKVQSFQYIGYVGGRS